MPHWALSYLRLMRDSLQYFWLYTSMEVLIFLLLGCLTIGLILGARPEKSSPPKPSKQVHQPTMERRVQAVFDPNSARQVPAVRELKGRAFVVDGDTLRVCKTQIQLFGIDAPEMNHPYGKAAKWAMVALCKGQTIRAQILECDVHGRTVAKCFLPDGRDLSAELVKQGLAIDWPKYSGGAYRQFEVDGIRQKLWLADARQKGRMHVWDEFETRQRRG